MSNDFCMDIDRDCTHIANMQEQLRMSDTALSEATECIVQMRDQIATLTRQRDLAVEALEWALSNINCEPFEWSDEENADAHKAAIEALSAIKESEQP